MKFVVLEENEQVNICKTTLVDNFITAIFISRNTILLQPGCFLKSYKGKASQYRYVTQERLIPHVPCFLIAC